jgi:hypothetical protein
VPLGIVPTAVCRRRATLSRRRTVRSTQAPSTRATRPMPVRSNDVRRSTRPVRRRLPSRRAGSAAGSPPRAPSLKSVVCRTMRRRPFRAERTIEAASHPTPSFPRRRRGGSGWAAIANAGDSMARVAGEGRRVGSGSPSQREPTSSLAGALDPHRPVRRLSAWHV